VEQYTNKSDFMVLQIYEYLNFDERMSMWPRPSGGQEIVVKLIARRSGQTGENRFGISHLVIVYSNMKDRLFGGLLPELSQKARKAVGEDGFSLNSCELS
jgi:hypothetical protein